MIRYHYAVHKGGFYFRPACQPVTYMWNHEYGVTINRGHVNCPDCLRMMGPE